jgi:hypothetical protein
LAPAVPNFLSDIISATAPAPRPCLADDTPLPAARPSTFSHQRDSRGPVFTAWSASSREEQITYRGEGIWWRLMNSRAKAFEPSISAARRLGQKMASPRRWNSSPMPRTIGSSGPPRSGPR